MQSLERSQVSFPSVNSRPLAPFGRWSVRMTALMLVSLALAYAVGQTSAGPEDCIETFVVSGGAQLTVSDGVVCFQCDVGAGIVSDPSFTISFSPISSDVGETVEGVLVIFDSGNVFQIPAFIECTSGGSSATAYVLLQEFHPPLISGNITVREGHNLSLDCDASNSQPLPSVAWFSPQSLQLSDNRNLLVSNISRSQAGNYSCVATDSNQATLSSSVTVTVEFPPEVTTSFSGLQYFPLGATLELSCGFLGIPAPESIAWYHNGTQLMASDLISIISNATSTTLTKLSLTEVEGGNYTCSVENVAGVRSVEISVRIQLPPSSPLNLEVESSSTESLLLVWNLPHFTGFSPVAGVRLSVSSGSVATSLVAEGPVTSYNVTGLQPLQTYIVDVHISNEAGLEGEPARVSTNTKSLRLPAVEELEVQVVSSTELYLGWMAPSINSSTTAAVQFYLVQYNSGTGMEGSSIVPGLNLTLEGLEKGTDYSLSVAGVNDAGVGKHRVASPVQTAVDAPSPPQNFGATSLTPFSMVIDWMEPADSGGRPLQQYILEMSVDSALVKTEQLSAQTSSAILQNLLQNTTYKLQLTAVNTAGLESDRVSETVTTLPVGPPQVPDSIRATAVTNQMATIVWEEAGGYPEYYILQYSEQNNNLSTVQVATLYHTITDLQPVTQYIVNVASYNLNGISDFSEDYTFGTFGRVSIEGPTDGVSGESLTWHCSVERIPSSPSPVFVWSREGGSLPAHSVITNSSLTLPDPSPVDSGVYVCSVAGGSQQISVLIDPKPQSNSTAIWVLAVSVCLAILFLVLVSVTCLCCCIGYRKYYGKFDIEGHKKRWEQEMKSKE